ncbi:hypothetical protein AOLI_G00066040 [Acnodon oligacanthus]
MRAEFQEACRKRMSMWLERRRGKRQFQGFARVEVMKRGSARRHMYRVFSHYLRERRIPTQPQWHCAAHSKGF